MSGERDAMVEAEIPASLQGAVRAKLDLAASERVSDPLTAGDATLGGPPGAPEIIDRLGWLTIAQRMLGEVGSLEPFAGQAAGDVVRDVVRLGMGGSSLAPEVLRRCFAPARGAPAASLRDLTQAIKELLR